jgi:predicted PurR-regulated permease PerM
MLPIQLNDRQSTLVTALLVLGTAVLGLVLIGMLASIFYGFGDILLIFFLAWLLAFILSPFVSALTRAVPVLPRVGAVVVVYLILVAVIIGLVVLVAGGLAQSVSSFIAGVPTLREQLPTILAPWQDWLRTLGFDQINLVVQAQSFIDNLATYAGQLAGPLQQLAVASLGAIGTVLLVVILSLYMVADRDQILSFFFRIVPPSMKEEARLLETSVAKSFGGFLRGQAILGLVYGVIVALSSAILSLPYVGITSAVAGVLMAIPFFGPFVAWAPPVIVAILAKPDALIPTVLLVGIGWLLVMNILQPRLMQEAVGIHPIVVLGSVIIGSKVAGITGAIFGIPIAAVLSAFFLHYLALTREPSPVTERAARLVEEREGRKVRIPSEPVPGVDPDVTA